MSSPIQNGKDTPLNAQTGTVPNVGGALTNWFQPMTFTIVTKETVGFQLVETLTPIEFRGVVQPFKERDLAIKPEGQRAWTWYWVHATPALILQVDDIVLYEGVQSRVMARKDYKIYGYVEYQLAQGFT